VTSPRTTPAQIRKRGIEALAKALGPVGMARFLQQFEIGSGAAGRMPRHQSFDEIQKGAFFRVPCVTLRKETEWVETVEAGWSTLVGCDPEKIVQGAMEVRPGVESAWPYGDATGGQRGWSVLGAQ